MNMDAKQMELHRQMVEQTGKLYDPKERLIAREFTSRGYHTHLGGGIVHAIHDSADYAVSLFESGRPEEIKRACDVIDRVIGLQDQNPQSPTFGIWSYYYEEPLEQMDPPDWNWANFIGRDLLYILLDHADKLDETLAEKCRRAVECACGSIMRRNAYLDYTNVCIMDIYVTLAAGELFQNQTFFNYGKQKLTRFLAFTTVSTNGETNEYNSPTYTMVAAEDLARILRDVKDPQARQMAEELNYSVWRCIGEHYHPATRQWSAPHSRCYDDFLTTGTQYKLELGTSGAFQAERRQAGQDTYRRAAACPKEVLHSFTDSGIKSCRKLIKRGFSYPFYQPAQTATTYADDLCTLGTFNREEFWNQTRPLMAYFAVEGGPVCMRLQVLHDFYDFSSAHLVCVQQEHAVLGNIGFATDRGDTHVNLDILKDATIQAKDMRIRLLFEGNTQAVKVSAHDRGCTAQIGGKTAAFRVPFCRFGNEAISFELKNGENGEIYFDAVLYHGAEKAINFRELGEAAAVFVLAILDGTSEPVMDNVSVQTDERFLASGWVVGGHTLECRSYLHPDAFYCMMVQKETRLDGVTLEEVAEQ